LKLVPGCLIYNRQGKGNDVGMADLTGCFRERHFEIEVKVLPDKPSDIQRVWLDRWRAAGALCIVAYSLEDVRRYIK
jgi:hypothetical protein